MEAKLASLLITDEQTNASEEGEDIKELLGASCQFLFNQKVEFVRGSDSDSHLKKLRRRYKPLNGPSDATPVSEAAMDCELERIKPSGDCKEQDGIPNPKLVLFDHQSLKLQWCKPRQIGAGLANLGNTCFLNSVLQCLTYTPPLVNFLSSGEHSTHCQKVGFCSLCELQRHTQRAFNGGVVKPTKIVQSLKAIGKHFRLGSQEDAHEFLRYFVDSMQRSCLEGVPSKLDAASKATTLVHCVFGGYLRSRVKCLECMKHSDTFDPMLDLSLDIKTCPSIEKALHKAIHPDVLDGPNQYACPNCKKFSKAEKHFRVHRMPKVLTLHLKRFSFASLFGSKVSKVVQYSEYLNLRPFTSQPKGPAAWYKLYAVLVHSGFSCHSGHYYCFVRNSNNFWYCMNDSVVRQVSQATVLSQEAYLLFYVLDPDYKRPEPKRTAATQKSVSQQHSIAHTEEMDTSGCNGTSVSSKSTLNESDAERAESPPPVPVRPSKPTGIVNPSPQKLPTAEQIPDAASYRISSSPPSMIPLRKSDNPVSAVQDTSKCKEKGFVPRNVVLSEKQKKLGVRPLQSTKSSKVQKQQQSSPQPAEDGMTNQPPLVTIVSDMNESFAVGKDHSQWTPVQDAVEEVYSSRVLSPAQSQQESGSTTNHDSSPKHSVASLSSASDMAANTLSMLPPALRDKQPKVAMVSPTLHAKPVARVLPSVNKTPATPSVVKGESEGNENESAIGNGVMDRSQCQQPSVDSAEKLQGDRKSKASYGPSIPSLEQGEVEKDIGGNLNEHRRRKKKKKKHRMADLEDSDDCPSRERLHRKRKRKKKHKHHRSPEDIRLQAHGSNNSTEEHTIKSHRSSSSAKGSSTKAFRTESNKEEKVEKHHRAERSTEGSLCRYPGNGSSTENGLVSDRGCYGLEDRGSQKASYRSNPDHSKLTHVNRSGCQSPLLAKDLAEHPIKKRKAERELVDAPLCPLKRRPVKSWEGNLSSLEARPWERKRQRGRDEWDAEYDRGKMKKVRREAPVDLYAERNPFQERQSKRMEKGLTQSHTRNGHRKHSKHSKQRDRSPHKHHSHRHKHHSRHHYHHKHHHGKR